MNFLVQRVTAEWIVLSGCWTKQYHSSSPKCFMGAFIRVNSDLGESLIPHLTFTTDLALRNGYPHKLVSYDIHK